MTLPVDNYNHQVGKAYKAARKNHRMYATDFGYADETLKSKGIKIAYLDGKHRKVKLVVNPGLLLGEGDAYTLWKPTSGSISDLRNTLKTQIEAYFQSVYTLNDFKLSRIDYAADIDVGDKGKVFDYIRVLHSVGRLKGYSSIEYGKLPRSGYFGVAGNNNGTEFRVYGLKNNKWVLRAEVRLTDGRAVRAYSDEADTSKQIKHMAKESETIFLDIFTRIVPFGDFRKKSKVLEIIEREVTDATMKRKMLRLLELVPSKKSLYLAQKASKIRDIDRVMQAFWEIGVAPVTISKRHGVKKLRNIYDYIFSR